MPLMRIAPISAGEVIAPNCALIMPTAALVSTYTSGSLSNSFVSPTSGGLRCRFFRGSVLQYQPSPTPIRLSMRKARPISGRSQRRRMVRSYAAHRHRSSRGRERVGMAPGSPYTMPTFYGESAKDCMYPAKRASARAPMENASGDCEGANLLSALRGRI